MNRYPYPVLTEEGSSYKEGIVFEISYLRSVCLSDNISFEFNIKMNSKTLKKQIDENKAKMVMKAQTGIFSTAYNIDIVEGNYKCTLGMSDIKSNDNIKFICYIVANDEVSFDMSDEINPVYGEEYRVNLKKNDILAVSNIETISYSTSNNDFIKFSVSDELNGNGYIINYETNYINVTVGPEFNCAYGILKNNRRDICTIFDSHLVFEVFVYTLVDLVQQYEEYNESEWYMLFEQVFLQVGEYKTFEEFIKSAKDDSVVNLSVIYDMAHKMINNQIENSLISLSKYEE